VKKKYREPQASHFRGSQGERSRRLPLSRRDGEAESAIAAFSVHFSRSNLPESIECDALLYGNGIETAINDLLGEDRFVEP
jgi:hypothetical protein